MPKPPKINKWLEREWPIIELDFTYFAIYEFVREVRGVLTSSYSTAIRANVNEIRDRYERWPH